MWLNVLHLNSAFSEQKIVNFSKLFWFINHIDVVPKDKNIRILKSRMWLNVLHLNSAFSEQKIVNYN